ncbi:hypothetical protein Bca4012_051035 [Brassica carinata]|uniref:Uncharacterized protein n=1 Tax=Brassica carinata TaxID=52824 RepID=A0A8X7UKW6_BRACI|nr:hypothetical protein Bca52824_053717 [Brassica carinata]
MHNINIKSPVKANVHARAAPAVGGSHRRRERFPYVSFYFSPALIAATWYLGECVSRSGLGAVNGSVGFRRLLVVGVLVEPETFVGLGSLGVWTQPALMWVSTSSIENGEAGFERVFDGVAFFWLSPLCSMFAYVEVMFECSLDPRLRLVGCGL